MDGKIYRIVDTSEIMYGHRVFDVVFDDGTIIRADADHKWHTYTYAERMAAHKQSDEYRQRRRQQRATRGTGKRPDLVLRNTARAKAYVPETVTGGIRTTLEIRNTLMVSDGKRVNHAIPVASPLDLPQKDLLIPPYILGYWLGDGNSHAGRVTIGDDYIGEAQTLFSAEGYTLRPIPSDKYGYTIKKLQPHLRTIGVLHNKHIPESYLFSSFEQRLSLLQGLMDTDGYATKDGQCEFYSSSESLINAVSRLLHTLGIKHAIRSKKPPKNTEHRSSYRIKFVAPFPVFRFTAKSTRQNIHLRDTQKWRYIVDVREVDSEPVKCIAIDSPDHLYLAGEACVPTHNTDLLLGLAGTRHHHSIIFRRIFPNLRNMIERSREIYNAQNSPHVKDSYNESLHIWRLLSGRMIEFSGIQYEYEKRNFQGRPHDFYGWDEITEFSESQFRFVNAWNRTTRPGQRCRVVATGNPPSSPEGEWVIQYWKPWLDDQHPNPAQPGELRWFAAIDGKDVEVEDNTPIQYGKDLIQPRSRTFIPASLDDNPYLRDTGYRSVLQGLPEPLRSQLLHGNFHVNLRDDAWQCIPTAWIIAAQNRSIEQGKPDVALRGVAVDPSRGGADETAIARIYGNYIEVITHAGEDVPDGSTAARYVTDAMGQEPAPIWIDSIGIGASVYDHLKILQGTQAIPVNVGSASNALDKSGRYQFANLRSQIIWQFREALDPGSGENLCLPPDRQLRNDLASARYQIVGGKIKVESKEDIKKRIGRSPDRGDVVELVWHGVAGSGGVKVLFEVNVDDE